MQCLQLQEKVINHINAIFRSFFGAVVETTCCFCNFEETINHLFFECLTRRNIWQQVLDWLQITHDLEKWEEELKWIVNSSKGKGWKVQLLKSAAAETVHAIWKYRNDVYFRKSSIL